MSLRFSANLGFLWSELNMIDRIKAAKQVGFAAVECHWPYAEDPLLIKQALQRHDLTMLGLNTIAGNLEQGDFGLAAIPGRENEARAAIDQAFSYAVTIGARNVHIMAGLSGDHEDAMSTFLLNLEYAAQLATQNNIGILIEPINRVDKPQYALHLTSQAIEVCQELTQRMGNQHPIRIMFDCYHVGRSGGDVSAELQHALPYIGHIQIAAVPDRQEPDHGEVDYSAIFKLIDALGYEGYIGAEYQPRSTTDQGLNWLAPYRARG